MSGEEILLISSAPPLVEFIKNTLRQSGFSIKVKKDIRSGVRVSKDSQIVLIDSHLSDGDCLDCLRNLNDLNTDLLPIVMIDERERETAAAALLNNAFFYTLKPLDGNELKSVVGRALEIKKLRHECRKLYQCTVEEFLGHKLKGYFTQIQKVGGIALYDTVISEVEKALLTLAIEKTGGNQLQASKLLGLNRNTVRNKMKKYKIKGP